MFLMQRYWGSDDEDAPMYNCSIEEQNDCLEKEKSSSHKKKKKVYNSENLNHSSDNIDDFPLNHSSKHNSKLSKLDDDVIETNCVPKASKKNSLDCQSFSENSIPKDSELDSSHKSRKRKKYFNGDTSDSKDESKNEKINDKCKNHTKQNLDFEMTPSSSPKKKRKETNSDKSPSHIVDQTDHNKKTVEYQDEVQKYNSASTEPELSHMNKKQKMKRSEESNLEEQNQKSFESKDVESINFLPIGKIKQKKDESLHLSVLPKWLSNPTIIEVDLEREKTPIAELTYLDDNIKQNLQKANIKFLFPVQLSVIPWLLQNKVKQISIPPSDLCVSSPTGSGKTLAFVIPIVQSLKNRLVTAVRALVVLPVIDLAEQVYTVFKLFTEGTVLKVALINGQNTFIAEQNALVDVRSNKSHSLVDIIITTPGRILDHLKRTKGFTLQYLRYLVIDEADEMMEQMQEGWLKQIQNAVCRDSEKSCICFNLESSRMSTMPTTACDFSCAKQPLQKLLYSATLSHDPEKLHSLSLYRPKLFTALSAPLRAEGDFIGKCTVPATLAAFRVICKDSLKPMILCHLIKTKNFKKVLCFTNTVERAKRLHIVLEEMGLFQVTEMSSVNTKSERKTALKKFSKGKTDVLVSSDLIARGMDIKDVDCVVSYDVPLNIKSYVHRMGRTAREGKNGSSITLASSGEFLKLEKYLLKAGMSIPEEIKINYSQDLKEYVPAFKEALQAADIKLKKIKVAEKKNNRRK